MMGRGRGRRWRRLWLPLVAVCLLLGVALPVRAQGDVTAAESATEGTETAGTQLQEALRELLGRYREALPEGIDPGIYPEDPERTQQALGFPHLLGELLAALSGRRGAISSFLLTLLGASLLFALGEMWELGGAATSAVAAVLAVPVFGMLTEAVRTVCEGLESANAFLSGILPVLSAITVAGGGGGTAAAQAAGMGLTLSLCTMLTVEVLLPLAAAMLSLSLTATLDRGGTLASLCAGLRSVFLWGMGVVSAVLAASLTLQSVIASAADGFTLRAARLAASDLIPVVGGAVSGALSTLLSGVSYVKSTVGVSAIVVLLLLLLAPLLELLIYRVGLSLCSVTLSAVGAGRGGALLGSFRAALDCVIAVYAVSGIVFVLQLVLFMKGGGLS